MAEKDTKKQVDAIHTQVQRNINSRLAGLRFRDMSQADFDASVPHDDSQVTFVQVDEDTIDMYKGDTKIGSSGSGGSKKAVMFANLSWGWDYKGSMTYTQATTQYGTTRKSEIKPNKEDVSAEDYFEVVPIIGFNPVYKPDGEHYETRYYNAIWLKNNVNLSPGDVLELPYNSNDTEYTLRSWHKCTYDTIGIERMCSASGQCNLITYTLFPGIVVPHTPMGLYGDANRQPLAVRGLDYFYNVGFYQFGFKPVLYIQEYTETNGVYSRLRSRYYDLWRISSAPSQLPMFKTVKQHNTTQTDSKFRYMNYTRTNGSESQDTNYHKEFGVCGLCLIIFADSLKDGVTYRPDFPEGSKYYPAAGFKFGIGIIYEDTTEHITWSSGDYYSLQYRNNAKKSYLKILDEDSTIFGRLGIKYATNNGASLSYCIPWYQRSVGGTYYPSNEESQRYLESLYILGQGRAANES